MKKLIIYYSYGGNTRRIAEMIQKDIGADLMQIETVKPYTGDYNAVVEQGRCEIDSGFLPDIRPLTLPVEEYDTVILGSPVWWYTFAPAMHTLLHQVDLSGKAVYPFATNGGWIGHTFEDFKTACHGATVHDGLNVRFDEAQLRTPQETIRRWAQAIR